MKVLFFTYYWPPSGKASLHLPLKIIKYFPKFGVEPIVVTINNDSFSQNDKSFLNDISPNLPVFRTRVIEPFNLYRIFTGKDKNKELIPSETISLKNKSLSHRISIWIRMNLFIPDARVGWYPYGLKEGKRIIKHYNPEAIITVGPPHSTHLIGLKLSKLFNLQHIPVFIDPWVDIAYYRDFKRNSFTLKIDNYLEKKVMLNSGKAIFVTNAMKEDYIKKYPSINKKSFVLHWGYSEDEFSNFHNLTDKLPNSNDKKIIVHAGNIFDYQNPIPFWQEIKRRNDNGDKYGIKFIGTVSPCIKSEIERVGLASNTEYLGFLNYKEMLYELFMADFLLVCASEKRHLPGKLFEYLRTGKPIIAFGDDNLEMENILINANAGMVFKYKDNGAVFFDKYTEFKRNIDYIRRFDRENITHLFSEIIKTR